MDRAPVSPASDRFLAWAYLDPSARLRSEPGTELPLAGTSVGVKDVLDVEGMPTSAGFAPYATARAERDASAVALLRAGGARIVGKTVSTEFAGPNPAATLNPRDPSRTPGGSSSGSAAAVAAGQVDVALGTQTAGSLVRPAAYCGVVGFKPSFGFINTSGLLPLAPSLDTIGVIARGVGAAARAAYVAGGWAPPVLAPAAPAAALVCWTDAREEASADSRALLGRIRDLLGAAGVAVTEIDWPAPLRDAHRHHRTIMATEAARSLAAERARFPDRLSAQLRVLLDEGRAVERTNYLRAQRWAETARHWFDEFAAGHTVLLTFAAPGEAPRGLTSTGSYLFNSAWTMLHAPCLTVPAGEGEEGMPLGVQLVAARGGDAELLAHGAWLETVLAGAVPGRSGR